MKFTMTRSSVRSPKALHVLVSYNCCGVHIVSIKSMKQSVLLAEVSYTLRELNTHYPMPKLAHLKRIKSDQGTLKILIAMCKDEVDELTSLEMSLKENTSITCLGKFSKVLVPKCKPITRKQYDAAMKHWPTQFHEDKRLEKALSGTLFTAKEVSQIENFMKMAQNEADIEVYAGAVMVDPVLGTVVAQAHTDTSHPLKHAVMLCIDGVAHSQGGGAWGRDKPASLLQQKYGAPQFPHRIEHSWKSYTKDDSVKSDPEEKLVRKSQDDSENLSDKNVELEITESATDHSCRIEGGYKSQTSATQRTVASTTADGEASVTKASMEQTEEEIELQEPSAKRPKKEGQYICTGYDLYTTKEPCTMCSMALVHSRIRRVFYCSLNPARGGLGSVYKIHTLQGLNHHYEVFRVEWTTGTE